MRNSVSVPGFMECAPQPKAADPLLVIGLPLLLSIGVLVALLVLACCMMQHRWLAALQTMKKRALPPGPGVVLCKSMLETRVARNMRDAGLCC